jgi:hypothetical protein
MTKTLNQIIFFPPPKSEYFFQQHRELEYFFGKKPLSAKFLQKGIKPHTQKMMNVHLQTNT